MKTDWAPGTNTGDLYIGSCGQLWSLFDGYIDELRISNVARSIEENAGVVYAQTFPGDADDDGQVKAADVLPLGFFYGETGEPRESSQQTCNWQFYNRMPWSNYRATFADCNGDGIVNSEDILCIGYNYNKISSTLKSRSILKSASITSLEVNYQSTTNQPKAGDIIYANVTIKDGCNLAGAAFDMVWNTDEMEPADEDYFESGDIWLSNPLVVKDVSNNTGRLGLGITNRNGKTILKDGDVAHLKIKLKKPIFPAIAIENGIGMTGSGESVMLSVNAQTTSAGAAEIGKSAFLKCYPNPFSGNTQIQFSLPEDQNCSLGIFNALGQEIVCLVNQSKLNAGSHFYNWNSSGNSSGIYFCKLTSGQTVFTQKLVVK